MHTQIFQFVTGQIFYLKCVWIFNTLSNFILKKSPITPFHFHYIINYNKINETNKLKSI